MSSEDQVAIRIVGQLEGLTAAVNGAKEQIESIAAPISGLQDAFGALGEVFAATFAVDKIAEFVSGIAEMGERLENMTHELGMSATELTTWNAAFQVMGMGSTGAGQSFERLAYNINQASISASGPAAHAFEAVGLKLSDLKNLSIDEVMNRLADAFSHTADGPNKTAVAIALLGRAGAAMIPVLDQGRAGLAHYKQIAQETGTAMSGPMLEGMSNTAESIHTLDLSFKGVGITLFEAFKPAIDVVIKGLTSLVEGFNNSLRSGSTLNSVLAGLVIAVDLVVAAIEYFINALRAMWVEGSTYIKDLVQAWMTLGTVMKDVVTFNFSAIQSDFAAGWQKMVSTTTQGLQSIKDIGQREVDDIKQLFSNITASGNVDTSGGADTGESSAAKPQMASLGEFGPSRGANKAVEEAKKAAQEKEQIQREEANTEVSLGKIRLQSERNTLDAEVKAGQISAAQRIEQLKQLAQQEYELDLKNLQNELATQQQGTVGYQRVYDQILVLKARFVAQSQQLDNQLLVAQQRNANLTQSTWQHALQLVQNDFDQMLTGVLRGTQTWGQAMQRVFDNLAVSMIENVAKMGLAYAAEALGMKATDKQTVLQDAKVAAANVYKWVSAIPYVGPFLAPEAAAAAFAAVSAFGSFDVGAWSLPSDMIAMVHQGEMIVPADVAAQVRAGTGGAISPFPSTGAGSASGGAPISVVFAPNIQAWNGQDAGNAIKNLAPVILNVVANGIKSGHPALRAALGSV